MIDSKSYILAPYFSAGLQNNKLFLGFGSIQKEISDPNQFELYLSLADMLSEAQSLNEAKYNLEQQGFDKIKTAEALDFFLESNFLIESHIYNKEERYSRHSLFYELSGGESLSIQEKLATSHVAVVGCGGIGNGVAFNLATAGVGAITLMDQDEIEISNLTRQFLFTEKNVGQSKTKILANSLKERAGNIKINIVEEMVKSLEDLEVLNNVDIVVVSADKGGAMNLINEYCVKNKIAHVNAGYINDIAVWGPFYIPGESGCYACQNIIADSNSIDEKQTQLLRKINSRYQAPSIGPINMMAAANCSLDVIKYLGEFGKIHTKNKRIGLWSNDFHLEEQNCSKNSECNVCGLKQAFI